MIQSNHRLSPTLDPAQATELSQKCRPRIFTAQYRVIPFAFSFIKEAYPMANNSLIVSLEDKVVHLDQHGSILSQKHLRTTKLVAISGHEVILQKPRKEKELLLLTWNLLTQDFNQFTYVCQWDCSRIEVFSFWDTNTICISEQKVQTFSFVCYDSRNNSFYDQITHSLSEVKLSYFTNSLCMAAPISVKYYQASQQELVFNLQLFKLDNHSKVAIVATKCYYDGTICIREISMFEKLWKCFRVTLPACQSGCYHMYVEDVCEINSELLYFKIWEKASKQNILFSKGELFSQSQDLAMSQKNLSLVWNRERETLTKLLETEEFHSVQLVQSLRPVKKERTIYKNKFQARIRSQYPDMEAIRKKVAIPIYYIDNNSLQVVEVHASDDLSFYPSHSPNCELRVRVSEEGLVCHIVEASLHFDILIYATHFLKCLIGKQVDEDLATMVGQLLQTP